MRSRGPRGSTPGCLYAKTTRSGYRRTAEGRETEVGDNGGRRGLDFRVGRSRFLKGLHEANRQNGDLQGLQGALRRRNEQRLTEVRVGRAIIMMLMGRCMIAAKRIIMTHKRDGWGGFFVGFKKMVGRMPKRDRMIYRYVELCTHAKPDGKKHTHYD